MDLFNTPDPAITEETLRVQLTQKWNEKFPNADPELIRSKVDSDLYVKTLESQKDEMRNDLLKAHEEIQKGKAIDELLDRLNRQNVQQPDTTPKAPENTPPSLKIDDVQKWYEDQKRIEKEAQNFNLVQSKLQERFGQRAGEFLAEQANTLQLTKDEINSLAKKSPEAFFRTMGLQPQGNDLFMAPPRSDLRNDSFAPKVQKRTWNYYQEMKVKNPTEYWSAKNQLQMHRDAEQLGAAFEDGDFNN